MNILKNILSLLETKMEEATAFGWFHLMWIGITIFAIFILFLIRKHKGEKQLKTVLGIYSIVAILLEILKQISWSFSFDGASNLIVFNYQWYGAPFQLCSTPMYAAIIALFLKEGKVRSALLSYISFITILGSITTVILPATCLIDEVLVNIHTMYLHCGSLVVSIFLLMNGYVKIKKSNYFKAYFIFLICIAIAEILNIGVYQIGILGDDTFDMFYISPYFANELPVLGVIRNELGFVLYFVCYLLAFALGSLIIYLIAKLIRHLYVTHDELHHLRIQYIEKFNKPFPVYSYKKKKEAIKAIKEALKEENRFQKLLNLI